MGISLKRSFAEFQALVNQSISLPIAITLGYWLTRWGTQAHSPAPSTVSFHDHDSTYGRASTYIQHP